jgi:hypothetical protein
MRLIMAANTQTEYLKITGPADIVKILRRHVTPALTFYLDDLDIDEKLILANPHIPFIHLTRESGTTLIMMEPWDHEIYPPYDAEKGSWFNTIPYLFGFADRYHILNAKKEIFDTYDDYQNTKLSILFLNGDIVVSELSPRFENEFYRSVMDTNRQILMRHWSSVFEAWEAIKNQRRK